MPAKKRGAGDLVIVESPAKAKTIERYLGPGYTVLASYGHVRDLPPRSLGVDVDNDFQPRYEPLKDRRRELDKLADRARKADAVWLATDLDREGESIAWHIADYANLPDDRLRRVTFSEITRPAIEEAFAHPRGINQDLVNAQQARRVIDRLVGYKLSPLVSSKIRRGLSAGRVQSVAVRLVVDRERDIADFVAEEYWSIAADLRRRVAGGGGFTAELTRIDGEKARIGNEEEARQHEAGLREAPYQVAKVTRSQQKKSAPPPFTTSTLQQEASRKLGFGARRTMSAAQKLYEGVALPEGQVGLITYMRTDSVAMASSAVAEARDVIRGRYGRDFVPDRANAYRTRARAQEAHEAIRPSSFARTPESLRGQLKADEQRLYDLIWRRALASQMAPARFDQVGVDVHAGRYTLHAGARKRTFDGYQALYVEGRDDEEDERLTVLPELTEGEPLDLAGLSSEQHFTQPPPRYTEATLIRALEEHGIGRPSTYAPTIEVIRQRGYVTIKDRRLFPEESAFRVTDLLKEHFPEIVDLEFTARMEDRLDDVARGEHEWVPMVRDFWVPFSAQISEGREKIAKQVEVTDIPCPISGEKGDTLVKRFGRNGWFLGCSGYPQCRHTQPLPGEESEEQPELPGVGEVCPECGQGKLAAKRGRFGPFVGCDRYPECRYIKKDAKPANEQFGTCPKCGLGTVVTKRGRRGRRPFWGCDRYPDCDYATWTRPASDGAQPQTAPAGGARA